MAPLTIVKTHLHLLVNRSTKSYHSELGWSPDRNDAERFAQFDYAVYCRDKEIGPRERRGVGVVKFA